MVSHGRGCIFQGFQRLQKVGKTTPEIVSKRPQNHLKSSSEGSPKRSLKLQWKIKKTLWKNVSKMRSKKGCFLMIFGTFLRSGSKVSQGGPRDPPRVPPGSKLLQNGSQNDSKIINKCCPEVFWKRFSKTHALSMFLNSSGLFLVCSYSCRGRLCVTFNHIYPSKVPTLIHLIRGENLRWMPLRCLPDVSQMPPSCLPRCLMAPRCLPDASPDAWCLPDGFQMPPRCPQDHRCFSDVSKLSLICPSQMF